MKLNQLRLMRKKQNGHKVIHMYRWVTPENEEQGSSLNSGWSKY
jgi:hypothetical protein